MMSDFLVGRYVKLHLMISDVGRWIGQRGSDVRSAILEFLLFRFFFPKLTGNLQEKHNLCNLYVKLLDYLH